MLETIEVQAVDKRNDERGSNQDRRATFDDGCDVINGPFDANSSGDIRRSEVRLRSGGAQESAPYANVLGQERAWFNGAVIEARYA